MPSTTELASILGADPKAIVQLLCTKALDADSSLYDSIRNDVIQKIAAIEAMSAVEGKRNPRNRVYIQHAVPDTGRFELVQAFPEFDIRFKGNDKRAAATATAAYQLASEYMVSATKMTKGKLLMFGTQLVAQVMRNRYYTHLCIPGHDPDVQMDCLRQDDNLLAIARKQISNKQPSGPATKTLERYVNDDVAEMRCFQPHTCTVQGRVAVLDMHATDAPFRQVAYYMRQHGVSLAFMSLPANEHMEQMTEGPFAELDAYVAPTGGEYITLTYKNAAHMDFTWKYTNYLELLARTTVVLGDVTYFKEFLTRRSGINIYKITATDTVDMPGDSIPYRSWPKADFAEYYKVYAPVLKPGMGVSDASAWDFVSFPVRRDVVDKVVSHAQSIEDAKDLYRDIRVRLLAATSTFILEGDLVTPTRSVSVDHFEMTAFAIYMQVITTKYKTGKAVTALTPYIREAALISEMAAPRLVMQYVTTVMSNILRSTDVFSEAVRRMYNVVASRDTSLLPVIDAYPGYTLYSDDASTNPLFAGWGDTQYTGVNGFSTFLPGLKPEFVFYPRAIINTPDVGPSPSMTAVMAMGEAYLDESGVYRYDDGLDLFKLALKIPTIFSQAVDKLAEIENSIANDGVEIVTVAPMPVRGKAMYTKQQQSEMLFGMTEQQQRQRVQSKQVVDLSSRILRGQDVVGARPLGYFEPFAMNYTGAPDITPGFVSTQPVRDLEDAIKMAFPKAQEMIMRYAESEKLYMDFDLLCKVIRGKLDMSRIEHLRPEEFFLPVVQTHLPPTVKSNTVNVLHAFAKRNANTPADAEDMDLEYLWQTSWKAMLSVFYVPDAERMLRQMEKIVPNFESVQEWVSKLDEAKRAKLEDEDFHFDDIKAGAHFNQLMLKGKSKPILDGSYEQSIKQPQTIQFDATGKTVAVFSPLLSQVVDREFQILKPKVFVMQRKNLDQVNAFLNNFDHRVDKSGRTRIYIEIDFSQFDKSQTHVIAKLYIKFLEKYGVDLSYTQFIELFQYARWVSAMSSGLMAKLFDQNPSGASFTLHRNNFATMIALAELFYDLLLEDVEHEFTMLMGDDNLTAVRGIPNVASWEQEINRKFNLTLKITVSPYGYMCSMHIVHLPDGRTRAVADLIKRALTFTDSSVKDESLFAEKFISFADNTQGLDDADVQHYLTVSLPDRLKYALPGVTQEAIQLFLGVVAAARKDEKVFRSMFARDPTTVQH